MYIPAPGWMKKFVLTNKNFIVCCLIMATVYLLDSLLFFTQFYLLYDFFEAKTINALSTGWAYVAQGAGLAGFIFLYRTKDRISSKRSFQVALFAVEVPVMLMSIFVKNGAVLVCMFVILNIIVGLHTGFTFTLATVHAPISHAGLCFGLAYTIGAFGTWMISLISGGFLTSNSIIFVDCALILLISVLILKYKDAATETVVGSCADDGVKVNEDAVNGKITLLRDHAKIKKIIIFMCIIIAIMAPISSIGSNNDIYVAYAKQLDLLAQRCFYSVGLIAAGLIFDKNRIAGGICTIVSLIYPIVLKMIYQESGMVLMVVGLSYVILGFFAVYRAASFMTLAYESNRMELAPLGLAIARIFEAISVLVLIEIGMGELTSVIVISILMIPLVVLFCFLIKELFKPEIKVEAETVRELSPDERKATFATHYGLTRREEEIVSFLSEGLSNSEIADNLQLSDSTIRFHVSNILKKTGMKDRNEVGRAYRM